MLKKHLYEAPDAELLEMTIEENFCGTNDPIKPWEEDPDDLE